jgi:hypothetical protein
MSLEILLMDALSIIVEIVGYILVVEMEKLMNEKIVIAVRRMYECVVEIEN